MSTRRPALFLDRDGTLIEERDYLSDPDEVRLFPTVGPALRQWRTEGFALVCLTNQSGVARGYFDEVAVARVHQRLHELLAAEDVQLDLILYAPTHPDCANLPGWDRTWRKPGSGMFEAAIERLDLDAAGSFSIGDAVRDLQAARSAGIEGRLLVETGHGKKSLADHPVDDRDWFHVVRDLAAAAAKIQFPSS